MRSCLIDYHFCTTLEGKISVFTKVIACIIKVDPPAFPGYHLLTRVERLPPPLLYAYAIS